MLEEKISILKSISQIAPDNASAEDEENLFANFLPLRSYSKLADAKVFLITGGRGAGKSELFRVLTSEGGLDHVLSEADRKRHTKLKRAEFIVGYQASGRESKSFPSKLIFDNYVKSQEEETITCLWGGMLCAALLRNFSEDNEIMRNAETFLGIEQSKSLLDNRGAMPEKWLEWMCCNREKWAAFLDSCDEHFYRVGKTVFVTYDELDRICSEYRNLFIYIRSLLSFWFLYNNRWEGIKAKIFLRSDLYNSKALHFVDSSKMRAYRLELQWDSLSLYRLLVKRMANCGSKSVVSYLENVPGLLSVKKQESLGYLPGDTEDAFRAFVEKIIGKYMGKDPKRGVSYNWVPNHIQDANGEVSPRPFLKCFVFAAQRQQMYKNEIAELEGDNLLLPSRLQEALVEVSEDRVKELVEDEYMWLETLGEKLKGQSMLMERSYFLKFLEPESWPEKERETLPGNTPEELLEALEHLGIFFETEDERMNAPEIYLHGFGLKRRGGIKRPR